MRCIYSLLSGNMVVIGALLWFSFETIISPFSEVYIDNLLNCNSFLKSITLKLTSKLTKKYRSSLPEMFCKKGIPKNFTKFTGKHLCRSLFFNKVAGLRLKKESPAQVFSCEFCEISKNTFFHRTSLIATSEKIGRIMSLGWFKKLKIITHLFLQR